MLNGFGNYLPMFFILFWLYTATVADIEAFYYGNEFGVITNQFIMPHTSQIIKCSFISFYVFLGVALFVSVLRVYRQYNVIVNMSSEEPDTLGKTRPPPGGGGFSGLN